MRHGKKNNHLGRTASHRKSLLSNLANSLILNKRIVTTLAKAKELRKYVEPILTKSKDDSTHNRRTVFSYLKNKESIKALFGDVSEKIANRNGGYTRIIKLGTRSGDAAETAMIELVDYNDILLAATAEKPVKTRRSRRSTGKSSATAGAIGSVESVSNAEVIHPVSEALESSEADIQSGLSSSSDDESSSSVDDVVADITAAETNEEVVADAGIPDSDTISDDNSGSATESGEENPDDEAKPEA